MKRRYIMILALFALAVAVGVVALDTKQAAERIGRLKAEITQLEKDRARYQQELDAYRAQVVARQ